MSWVLCRSALVIGLSLGFGLLLPLAVAVAPAQAQVQNDAPIDASGRERVIITYRSGPAADALQGLEGPSIREGLMERLANMPGAQVNRTYDHFPFIALSVDSAARQALENDPAVMTIEPDRLSRTQLASSIPFVGAPAAHSRGLTGAGQAIAILDNGIDNDHPFFGGRVAEEACFSGGGTTQGSLCILGLSRQIGPGSASNTCGVNLDADACGHGSHVTGAAAGYLPGNTPSSGVAPGATILFAQIFTRFNDTGNCGNITPCLLSYTSDQFAALDWVAGLASRYRIAAVNLSLGGSTPYQTQAACDAANNLMLQAFTRMRNLNIAPVVASGNSSYNLSLAAPACVTGAISVGSVGDTGAAADVVSSFTNAASFLTFLAPGETIFSSVAGAAFSTKSGTSMAAPHVAGAFALLRQAIPNATVDEMVTRLRATARQVSFNRSGNSYVFPRINLDAATQGLAASVVVNVAKTGNGTGRISAIAAGIDCGTSCSGTIPIGQNVILTAIPDTGNRFLGWSGDCASAGANASVSLTGSRDLSCSANFVRAPGDMTGDGKSDLVFRSLATGQVYVWGVDGARQTGSFEGPTVDRALNWEILGNADFDGDGLADLLWRNNVTGAAQIWLMTNATRKGQGDLRTLSIESGWQILAATDFDGDGKADLLWRNGRTGETVIGLMDGWRETGNASITTLDPVWAISAAADFDSDGKADLLWRNRESGEGSVWLMNGVNVRSKHTVDRLDPASGWRNIAVADLTGDKRQEILWADANGNMQMWTMNSGLATAKINLTPNPGGNWELQAIGEFDGDGRADLVWRHRTTGEIVIWLMAGANVKQSSSLTNALPNAAFEIAARNGILTGTLTAQGQGRF